VGWTFRDIEQHTDAEIVVALIALSRKRTLEAYEPSSEDLNRAPEMVDLKNAILEERDKLEFDIYWGGNGEDET